MYVCVYTFTRPIMSSRNVRIKKINDNNYFNHIFNALQML